MTWFTDADVEAAARAICWAEIGGGRVSAASDVTTVLYVNANWHRNVYQARAALAAIPDPRAAGFIAARDEIHTETARMWPEAVDLLEYIAALKPEDKP